MERSLPLLGIIITSLLIGRCIAIPAKITFEKCDYKGFTCQNPKNITGKVDVVFQCNATVTTDEVLFNLWNFNSPAGILSLTIKDCEKVQISFTCTGENKPIQWLKIQNVKVLEIIPAILTHNPPEIYFENIQLLENIPRNSFGQIRYDSYRAACFLPVADLYKIEFSNVNIGNIETEAFRNLMYMKEFTWNKVAVKRISTGAIKLNFESISSLELKRCTFGVIEPMAFQVIGDSFSISTTTFSEIWGNGINATIHDFRFSNNSVTNMHSGGIAILARNAYIVDNHFESIETGAFKKISPGLLHDSQRNFGKLNFVYKFSNNLIENVEDGGVRPDIPAYKNVASQVSYTSNSLQCSCAGLSWHGADVDLGYGYSVLKDFNTMVLEPQDTSTCNLTPCMCFGIRPPHKKNTLPDVEIF